MTRNRFGSIRTLDDLEKYSKPIRKSFLKIQNSINKLMEEYQEYPEVIEILELKLDILWIYYLNVENDYKLRYDILTK